MPIVNAKLYEEEIRRKMWEIAYEPEYQYYFGDTSRNNFEIQEDSIGSVNRAFAVLGADGKLIGVINYSMDTAAKVAMWFGAINFSGTSASKLTFSKALYQVITDCFIKFGCEVSNGRLFKAILSRRDMIEYVPELEVRLLAYYTGEHLTFKEIYTMSRSMRFSEKIS